MRGVRLSHIRRNYESYRIRKGLDTWRVGVVSDSVAGGSPAWAGWVVPRSRSRGAAVFGVTTPHPPDGGRRRSRRGTRRPGATSAATSQPKASPGGRVAFAAGAGLEAGLADGWGATSSTTMGIAGCAAAACGAVAGALAGCRAGAGLAAGAGFGPEGTAGGGRMSAKSCVT